MTVKLSDLPEAGCAELYQDAWKQFHTAWKANKLHHAWLITGVKGIGKTDFAYHMASALLSNGRNIDKLSDVKPIEFHPNLHKIDLTTNLDEEAKKLISVDNIRQMQAHMRMTSSDGQYKVTLISPADYMNRNAANAILKTLEEPRGKAILIIICHSIGKLPETIRSRCMKLAIPALSQKQLLFALHKAYPKKASAELMKIVQLSHGQFGYAKELIENSGLDLYNSILSILQEWPNMNASSLFDFSEKYAQKKEVKKQAYIKDILMSIVTRSIKFISSALPENQTGEGELIFFKKLTNSHPKKLLKIMDEIEEFDYKAKTFHIDQQLILLRYFQLLRA